MKRLTTAAAAALLATSLAACSNSDGGETATPAPASPSEATSETTASETTGSETSAAPDSDDDADDNDDDGGGANSGVASGDGLPPAGATAMQTVLAAHPGDVIELDWHGQRNQWKVDVLSGDKKLQVYTSPAGNEIVEVDDRHSADQKDRDRASAVQVSITDAVNKVMAEHPGTFDEAQLDEDDGRLIWQIEIDNVKGSTDSVEAYVDAKTGEMWLDD